jgi:hypothetical protein
LAFKSIPETFSAGTSATVVVSLLASILIITAQALYLFYAFREISKHIYLKTVPVITPALQHEIDHMEPIMR